MGSETNLPPTFQVHYIKTSQYKEVSVDGAVGGRTPKGDKIWMALYAERWAIPQVVEYHTVTNALTSSFSLDETRSPHSVQSRQGLIRTVEMCAYIDVDAAKRLQAWLSDRIAEIEGSNALKS